MSEEKIIHMDMGKLDSVMPGNSDGRALLCLGIESSCDETSAAIVDSNRNILSHIIYSQIPEHQEYGGVVPELAARAHILAIDDVIRRTLGAAGKTINDIDIVAATAGPGLIGGVLVGWMAAVGIAQSTGKPLVAVNHLEGHALVPRLHAASASGADGATSVDFPYLLLLASGGHCQILLVRGVGKYDMIGQTLDDSAGEAFDKVAKMLNLGTAARTFLNKVNPPYSDDFINDFCASFQAAVVDCMTNRLTHAMQDSRVIMVAPKTLVVAGGVAKNSAVRASLEKLATQHNMVFAAPPMNLCTDNGAMIAWAGLENYQIGFAAPPMNLCTDNGAMIAWAGLENYQIGRVVKSPIAPRPRWSLTEM